MVAKELLDYIRNCWAVHKSKKNLKDEKRQSFLQVAAFQPASSNYQ